MRSFIALSLFVVTVAGAASIKTEKSDGRSFSLFSVVSFGNDECTGQSSKNKGTCFTADECTSNGGNADGNCASGFGVCCTFTVSDCTGATISKNITYIQNKDYPSTYTTSGTCSYTINRVKSDICQLRLDFDTLVLAEPTTGECTNSNTDKLSLTSPTGFATPGSGGLCGDNLSGQHLYVETGNSGSITLSILVGTTTASRNWNIKVTQLECSSHWKAPEGCGQYFTGTSGNIQSYNVAGAQMIQSHNYVNCIRQESGYCGIQYRKVSMDTDATIDAMSQSVDTSDSDCAATNIRIPDVVGAATNEFCGSILSVGNEASIDGVLTTYATPFMVGAFTATGTALTGFDGWELMYSQVPC